MRSLLIAVALSVAATGLQAQRAERTLLTPAIAKSQLPVASVTLFTVPSEAVRPFGYDGVARRAIGADGGRVIAIVLGAAIGGAAVYFGVKSIDCSDCDGNAATYGAIGGAVVGGFIGSSVYSFRQRRAVTPPSSIGS